ESKPGDATSYRGGDGSGGYAVIPLPAGFPKGERGGGEYGSVFQEKSLVRASASDVNTFFVANEDYARDAATDPRCALHVPSIVCYERDGRTTFVYERPSAKLKMFRDRGFVSGEMADEHMKM